MTYNNRAIYAGTPYPGGIATTLYNFHQNWMVDANEPPDYVNFKFRGGSITRVRLNTYDTSYAALLDTYAWTKDMMIISYLSTEGNPVNVQVLLKDYDEATDTFTFDPITSAVDLAAVLIELAQLQVRVAALEAEDTNLQAAISNILNDITNLQTQITSNDVDISTLQTDVSDLDSRITALESNPIPVQSDWAETDGSSLAFIKNKPNQTQLRPEIWYCLIEEIPRQSLTNITVPITTFFRFDTALPTITRITATAADIPNMTEIIVLARRYNTNYSGNIAGYGIAGQGYLVSRTITNSQVQMQYTSTNDILTYEKQNAYYTGQIVFDGAALYSVVQDVPLPASAALAINIQNDQYYEPISDQTLMQAKTIWVNNIDAPYTGEDVAMTEVYQELQRLSGTNGMTKAQITTALSGATALTFTQFTQVVIDGKPMTSTTELVNYFDTAALRNGINRLIFLTNGTNQTYFGLGLLSYNTSNQQFTITPISQITGTNYVSRPSAFITDNFGSYSNGSLLDSGYNANSFVSASYLATIQSGLQTVSTTGNGNALTSATVNGTNIDFVAGKTFIETSALETQPPYPSSGTLIPNSQQVWTAIQNALASNVYGLDSPISIDKESNLPSAGTVVDKTFYFVEEMDVSYPGFIGFAWKNDAVNPNVWQTVRLNIATQQDNVSIVIDGSGKFSVSTAWLMTQFTGAISTCLTSNLTSGRIVHTDTNGKLAASSIVSSTLQTFLNNAPANINTALAGKQATISGTGIPVFNGTTITWNNTLVNALMTLSITGNSPIEVQVAGDGKSASISHSQKNITPTSAATQTLAPGGTTFSLVSDITYDNYGHLTGFSKSPVGVQAIDASSIGSFSISDDAASNTLIPVAAKTVQNWINGIRQNLKWLLNRFTGTSATRAVASDTVKVAATNTTDTSQYPLMSLDNTAGDKATTYGPLWNGSSNTWSSNITGNSSTITANTWATFASATSNSYSVATTGSTSLTIDGATVLCTNIVGSGYKTAAAVGGGIFEATDSNGKLVLFEYRDGALKSIIKNSPEYVDLQNQITAAVASAVNFSTLTGTTPIVITKSTDNKSATVSHANKTQSNTTTNQTLNFGGSITALSGLTVDATGHVGGYQTKTVNLPLITENDIPQSIRDAIDTMWNVCFPQIPTGYLLTTSGNVPITQGDLDTLTFDSASATKTLDSGTTVAANTILGINIEGLTLPTTLPDNYMRYCNFSQEFKSSAGDITTITANPAGSYCFANSTFPSFGITASLTGGTYAFQNATVYSLTITASSVGNGFTATAPSVSSRIIAGSNAVNLTSAMSTNNLTITTTGAITIDSANIGSLTENSTASSTITIVNSGNLTLASGSNRVLSISGSGTVALGTADSIYNSLTGVSVTGRTSFKVKANSVIQPASYTGAMECTYGINAPISITAIANNSSNVNLTVNSSQTANITLNTGTNLVNCTFSTTNNGRIVLGSNFYNGGSASINAISGAYVANVNQGAFNGASLTDKELNCTTIRSLTNSGWFGGMTNVAFLNFGTTYITANTAAAGSISPAYVRIATNNSYITPPNTSLFLREYSYSQGSGYTERTQTQGASSNVFQTFGEIVTNGDGTKSMKGYVLGVQGTLIYYAETVISSARKQNATGGIGTSSTATPPNVTMSLSFAAI